MRENMPCTSIRVFLLLLCVGASRPAASAALGEGAAAAASGVAFVPPAGTNRSWFGSAASPKASAIDDNIASTSKHPDSACAAPSPANTYASRSRRTWIPSNGSRAASSTRRSAMVVEAAGGSTSPPKIIIAGAPASGKGTQCSMIKERYGVVHLSTGDMLREAVKNETPVGMKAKGFMDEGKLVPDEVIIGIVRDRLNEEDCHTKGWLLDGFPRTRAQADALAAEGIKADSFLLLNVPDEMLIQRVVGRRLDPETGDIYHLDFNPPPADIVDRLVHRADDTAEKAKVRLEQYHSNIAAIRECYEDITFSLDGAVGKDEVFEAITGKLDSKMGTLASSRGVGEGGEVVERATVPIEGMKPGTSGLRKKE